MNRQSDSSHGSFLYGGVPQLRGGAYALYEEGAEFLAKGSHVEGDVKNGGQSQYTGLTSMAE